MEKEEILQNVSLSDSLGVSGSYTYLQGVEIQVYLPFLPECLFIHELSLFYVWSTLSPFFGCTFHLTRKNVVQEERERLVFQTLSSEGGDQCSQNTVYLCYHKWLQDNPQASVSQSSKQSHFQLTNANTFKFSIFTLILFDVAIKYMTSTLKNEGIVKTGRY